MSLAVDSPARALAKCILDWIYQQAKEILEMLKAFILGLIAQIDAIVTFLRAWLAQWDLLAKAEEAAWKLIQKIIDEIRNALLTVPDGPLAEFCPQFFTSLMAPAVEMFEMLVVMLTIFREKFHDSLSYMDEIDRLIGYWESIKIDLMAMIELIDDALLIAKSQAGEAVP